MTDQELAAWEADQITPQHAFYVALGLFTHKFGNVDMQLTRLITAKAAPQAGPARVPTGSYTHAGPTELPT